MVIVTPLTVSHLTLKPRLDYFLTNSQVLFSSLFPKDLV